MNFDDLNKASELQLGLAAESLEMNLQPLANAVDLLELGEEGQPELRLLDDADEELQYRLIVVDVSLIVKGVHEIVEEPYEPKEGLPCHSDITVLRHVHEDGQQHFQQNGVAAASAYHLHELKPQKLACSVSASSERGEDHLKNDLESLVVSLPLQPLFPVPLPLLVLLQKTLKAWRAQAEMGEPDRRVHGFL